MIICGKYHGIISENGMNQSLKQTWAPLIIGLSIILLRNCEHSNGSGGLCIHCMSSLIGMSADCQLKSTQELTCFKMHICWEIGLCNVF